MNTARVKNESVKKSYINETKIKVESQYNNMGIEDDYSMEQTMIPVGRSERHGRDNKRLLKGVN